TKVRILRPSGDWAAKKFDKISSKPASNIYFKCTNSFQEGREMSVAQYWAQVRQIRLDYPNLPCLEFYNKMTRSFSYFPLECCMTNDEPRKFKGKLTDGQLNTFMKVM
ncbi:hypothetical protein PMAYCL1PPCAC_01922, partial [Pristionchus mayeri]